jgi:hypothetical protein
MARVVGRARPQGEGAGTGMKLSETGIFIAMGIIAVFAIYWYFTVYKHSPGVALNEYIGAIKSGNVEKQYAMLDAADKQMLPSEKEYEEKCKQARGYTERIIGVTLGKAVPDAKDPDPQHPTTVSIEATVSVRGQAGKNLTDNGETAQATDKYVLHRDAEGNWKVVLSKGWPKNLLLQTPNPPGSSF